MRLDLSTVVQLIEWSILTDKYFLCTIILLQGYRLYRYMETPSKFCLGKHIFQMLLTMSKNWSETVIQSIWITEEAFLEGKSIDSYDVGLHNKKQIELLRAL
jgi:hypothetical protein